MLRWQPPDAAFRLPKQEGSYRHGHRHQTATIAWPKKPPLRANAGKKAKDAASILDSNPDLKNTLAQIEKQFGEGAIMPLGVEHGRADRGHPHRQPVARHGPGRPGHSHAAAIIEIFGPESSGKTTLALHVVAQAQKAGGIAAFIDAEHALDPSWAKKLGVDLETLLVSQPSSGEEAMHITEMLIKSNAVDVIVIDSVAALVPKKELEGEIGDSHVGLQARLMSQSMRKLTGAISKSKTCGDLHQPDPREDRRHVRQPRNHARRPGPEVLLAPAASTSAASASSRKARKSSASGCGPRWSRTRSPRRSASPSST